MAGMNSEDTGGEDFDFSAAGDEISTSLFGAPAAPAEEEVIEASAGVEELPADPPPEGETPPAAEPAPAAPATAAPKTWRPEAAAHWAALPPEAQAEILKREEDIFRGLESYKVDAGLGKSVKQILDPYMPMLQQAGIDPVAQIDGLMKAHHLLATGTPEQKQLMFQHLAREYRVDLGQAGDTEAPYIDPQVAGLQKQLADLQSKINGREQQEAASIQAKLKDEINTFASDPAHVYFDEIAHDIAGLLKSGAAKDLKDAYEKAIWANPATRAKEQARQTAEAAAKAKAEEDAKAVAARKATGANVRSKAAAASATAPLGSIDDTLKSSLAAIRGRAS